MVIVAVRDGCWCGDATRGFFGVEHRIFPHVLGTGEQGCSAGKPDTHSPGSTRAKAPVIVDVVGDGARVGFQVSGT